MKDQTPRSYQFGPFSLDAGERKLLRDGSSVALTAKTFDTLLLLVRNAGRLVSKKSLMESVWSDRFVEEGNVAQHISMLRRALREHGAWIETIPAHGYRLVAPVHEVDGGFVASRRTVVGIAPFEMYGGAAEEYLGIGIAEGITRRLSRIAGLAVRPLRGSGNELQVDATVRGTIRHASEMVRATVELVDAAGATSWSEKFDERWADLFSIEDVMSTRIADALVPRLTPSDRSRVGGAETVNADAYRSYLRGRFVWTRRTAEGIRKAIEHFEEAIEADPAYARAYSGLADCYSQLAWNRLLPPADAFPRARAAAERALRLDASLAEAHASVAWIAIVHDCAWDTSEREFRNAVALDPSCFSARIWSSVLFSAQGRFEEAVDAVTAARDVDPLSPLAATLVGWPHHLRGDLERAIGIYDLVLQMHPNHFPARLLRAQACIAAGAPLRAIEDAQVARTVDDTSWSRTELAAALAAAGRHDEARRIIDALSGSGAFVCPFDLAVYELASGDREAALDRLEAACRERSVWRFLLGVEPRFAALRGTKRFTRLLRELSLAG